MSQLISGNFSLLYNRREYDLKALRDFVRGTADKITAGRATFLIRSRMENARRAGLTNSQIAEIVALTVDTLAQNAKHSSPRMFLEFVTRLKLERNTLPPLPTLTKQGLVYGGFGN